MAESYVQIPADGSTTVFNFNFDYLDTSHVTVLVDGVDTSFSWLGTYSVSVSPAPTSGKQVRVRRTTPRNEPVVNYTDGSVLVEADLDATSLQMLYVAVEAFDAASETLQQTALGVFDALDLRLSNIAPATDQDDAVTVRYIEDNYSTPFASVQAALTAAALNTATASDAKVVTEALHTATQILHDAVVVMRDEVVADRLLTAAAVATTAANKAQTALDVATTSGHALSTAADRSQTGLDAEATAADRAQVALDAANVSIAVDGSLLASNNLSDITDAAAARENLEVNEAASGVTYDNTGSGLDATDAQSALDEIASTRAYLGHHYPKVTPSSVLFAAQNTSAINSLITTANLLGGGFVYIPAGLIYVNTILMKSGVHLVGVNRQASILIDDRSDTNSVIKSADNTSTILWARVSGLGVKKPNATGGNVIDMSSWQFCEVRDNWITSSSAIATCCVAVRGLYTTGPVFTTEGTYNRIEGNYIGLTAFGIRLGANANTCWVRNNRIQPNINNGAGVILGSSGAETAVVGYPNNVIVESNSVETIDVTGVRGVLVQAEADDVRIMNNRFEGSALSYGIEAISGCTNVLIDGNHYSGISTKNIKGLNSEVVSLDGNGGRGRIVPAALVNFIGTTGVIQGAAHNVSSVVRNGPGDYTISFENYIGTPVIASPGLVTSSALSSTISVSDGAIIRVLVKDDAGLASDALQVMVVVWSGG